MEENILVLGSSNIDLILRVPDVHRPGETIQGENVVTVLGGKGANQALAARRLGGKVSFMTKVGDDHYGQAYRWYLIKNGFDRRYILRGKDIPTGMAFIELNQDGENRIIISPGANASFSGRDLRKLKPPWNKFNIFVAQLEIPLTTVRISLQMAKAHGVLTLLNPSPPVRLPADMLSTVDVLVPNELEAQYLSGVRIKGNADLRKAADRLLKMGAKNVVITLGSKGLFFKNKNQEIRMEAFRVKAVDSTAAGDAFMGALACGLTRERPIQAVLQFANAAGALATTKLGAQPSLPLKRELHLFLSKMRRK